ncbi:class I SAM-dependent methyltransferase [Streptomyces sp. NPDC057257]|uniref:class I SAM-dependent methyltransferase n=1 Tax=Streptomyces sp. NPDC057257 TaxID=3346071 RepID=UPI0036414C2D
MADDDVRLTEQIAYYRAHAAAYDRAYTEREDLRRLPATVGDLPIRGDVLELACGTGQWTGALAARARSVTAVDVATETLDIARVRVSSPHVRFVRADVFAWQPSRRYDTVFFAFWLSHVPPSRLAAFWHTVAMALSPGGKAVFVDDGPAEAAHETFLARQPVPTVVRQADDGRRYRVVKLFHSPARLTRDLTSMGWSADVRPLGKSFIRGVAEPPGNS